MYPPRYVFCCPFCAYVHHTRLACHLLWCRLQRTAVKNRGDGLFITPFSQPQHGPQVLYNRLKHARSNQRWACRYTLYHGGR